MRRKSMAVAMAAVTMATSVAPIVANAAENEVVREVVSAKNSAKLVSQVRELLKKTYTDEKETGLTNIKEATEAYMNSVYKIDVKVTKDGSERTVQIKNATELSDLISKLGTEYGTKLEVVITNKGFTTNKENKVVATAVETYTISQLVRLKSNSSDFIGEKKAIKDITFNNDKKEATVILNAKDGNGRNLTITLREGSNKLNFAAPIDRNGKIVEVASAEAAAHPYQAVVNFKDVDATDIKSVELANVTVTNGDVANVKLASLYDGIRLTKDGQAMLSALTSNHKGEGAVEFKVDAQVSTIEEVKKDEAYTMVVNFVKTGATSSQSKTVVDGALKTITIEANNKADLQELSTILTTKTTKINVVAGEDRYETAVAVSKELRKDAAVDGKSVVLVNSEALVDGLAATPFATAVKAPVLLTNKNAVPTATMNEVKDVLNFKGTTPANMKDKTIYVIGGESVISKDVEAELAKLGAKVVRIAGNDRHETSVEVAEAMTKVSAKINRAFVVGATGEADAMSISSFAAESNAPIIVNGFNGISKDAAKLLDGKNIDIIGGEKAVNETVEAELKAIDADEKIVRVKGDNRHETNANVINKYYTKTLSNVLVAKDGYAEGNGKLVDALAAGTLAAAKKAPIVLATNDLTVSQNEILELRLGSDAKVSQIGNGVQLTVIEKIAKKLGLK